MGVSFCRICERFFNRSEPAVGFCASCACGFCAHHGLKNSEGEGVCLFCAEEFGSRLDALVDDLEQEA